VDRLVAEGVIEGFAARINPAALGWHAQAWVSVTYAGNVTPDRIRAILQPIPQVVAAYTVSGDADVLVRLRAADMADLERSLETLRATGAVARTQSTIVLSTLLDRTDTPLLDPVERDDGPARPPTAVRRV
jgi:DNA-binding Lrp family transcriptional regulator